MIMNRLAKVLLTLSLLITFGGLALAQSTDQSQTPPPDNSTPKDQNKDQNKDQKKDKKKKKDKDKGSQDIVNSDVFSEAVGRSVLDDIRDGLEGHSPRLMESAFDEDKMDGYLSFEDAVEAMFQRYSEFRVHFTISQTSIEGPKGIILVDIEMEAVPNSTNGANVVPQRRQSQVRFELERGKKGWKIVDFSPRSFFS
jgi:hypothetical protein